jgi:hypothetical protein
MVHKLLVINLIMQAKFDLFLRCVEDSTGGLNCPTSPDLGGQPHIAVWPQWSTIICPDAARTRANETSMQKY